MMNGNGLPNCVIAQQTIMDVLMTKEKRKKKKRGKRRETERH